MIEDQVNYLLDNLRSKLSRSEIHSSFARDELARKEGGEASFYVTGGPVGTTLLRHRTRRVLCLSTYDDEGPLKGARGGVRTYVLGLRPNPYLGSSEAWPKVRDGSEAPSEEWRGKLRFPHPGCEATQGFSEAEQADIRLGQGCEATGPCPSRAGP